MVETCLRRHVRASVIGALLLLPALTPEGA